MCLSSYLRLLGARWLVLVTLMDGCKVPDEEYRCPDAGPGHVTQLCQSNQFVSHPLCDARVYIQADQHVRNLNEQGDNKIHHKRGLLVLGSYVACLLLLHMLHIKISKSPIHPSKLWRYLKVYILRLLYSDFLQRMTNLGW